MNEKEEQWLKLILKFDCYGCTTDTHGDLLKSITNKVCNRIREWNTILSQCIQKFARFNQVSFEIVDSKQSNKDHDKKVYNVSFDDILVSYNELQSTSTDPAEVNIQSITELQATNQLLSGQSNLSDATSLTTATLPLSVVDGGTAESALGLNIIRQISEECRTPARLAGNNDGAAVTDGLLNILPVPVVVPDNDIESISRSFVSASEESKESESDPHTSTRSSTRVQLSTGEVRPSYFMSDTRFLLKFHEDVDTMLNSGKIEFLPHFDQRNYGIVDSMLCAGKGLIALKEIQRGSAFGDFGGVSIEKPINMSTVHQYMIELVDVCGNIRYYDCSDYNCGYGRFMNDPFNESLSNVKIVLRETGLPMMFALRDIEPGEELLMFNPYIKSIR